MKRALTRAMRVIAAQAAGAALTTAGQAIAEASLPEPARIAIQIAIGATLNALGKERREAAWATGERANIMWRIF
jgi:hypothetical protein